jgi:hypothetical protein
MSNMSYCRFENTQRDMVDCNDALRDNDTEDLSEYEELAVKSMLHTARELVSNLEDFHEVKGWEYEA